LTLTTEPNAVVVPSEAVQVGPEGQHVFVVQPDKRVEVRPVTLGTTSGGEAVIRKGLAAGEQIVREGQFLLGPGSRVEIKENAVSEAKEEKKDRAGKGKAKAQEGGQS
jgi:multidrug efflux system membrane fusion protein